MSKIIVFIDPQGRYRITSPGYMTLAKMGLDADEAIQWVWDNDIVIGKGIPASTVHFFIEGSDFKAHNDANNGEEYFWRPNKAGIDGKKRTEDGAWTMGLDGLPVVDMVKAGPIHMDGIREVRDQELIRLDGLQVEALGKGDDVERNKIESQKQTLRDIPQTFDLSGFTTPNDLKAAWPVELPERD